MKRHDCGHSVVLGGAVCLALAVLESHAVTVAVKPASVAWNSNCWVSVTISNLSALGATVGLDLIVDADGDGVNDAGQDYVVQHGMIQDGATNPLGSVTYPDDDDATTNKVIVTKVSHFGGGEIGSFIFRVSDGASVATAAFTNTQSTTTTYITGSVYDYNSGVPVAGAVAGLAYFSDRQGVSPAQYTDANGRYKIYLPSGVTVSNVYYLMVMRPGYAGLYLDPDGYIASLWPFMDDLTSGSNGVPELYLFSTNQPGIVSISGRGRDPTNGPVAGAGVSFFGDHSWGIAVTDTNGNYLVPAGLDDRGALMCDRGDTLPAAQLDGVVVTGRMTGVDLVCPFAVVLARGSITNRANGAAVTGASVDFVAAGTFSYASTVSGGVYEVALASGVTYSASIGQDELQPRGYAEASRYEGLTVSGTTFTNVMFGASTGYLWSGVVSDTNRIALSWGEVQISGYGSHFATNFTGRANNHGYYEVLVATGVFQAVTADFEDYVELAYSNRLMWSGVKDPVVVTTAGVKNINFVLPSAARVEGVVLGSGLPVEGVTITAYEKRTNALEWRIEASTDRDGTYLLYVPPGTSYVLRAESPLGPWWPQYYDHKAGVTNANLVKTSFATAATNINFDLSPGLGVWGRITGGAGLPISNIHMAVWVNQGADTNRAAAELWSGYDGIYHAVVSGGVSYSVSTVPDPGNTNDWFPRMWFDGSYSRLSAALISGTNGEVVPHVDFTLEPGYRVEGYARHADTTTPLAAGLITPYLYTSGVPVAMDAVAALSNGWYSACVPANVPFVLQGADAAALHAPEYYDNQYSVTTAVVFLTNATQFRERVDFALYDYAADTDGDGVRDFEEDTRPDGRYIAGEDWSSYTNRDTDHDGFEDLSELIAGTAPGDAGDRLVIREVARNPDGAFAFEWSGVAGRYYDIYWTDTLMETDHWAVVFSTNVTSSGALTGFDPDPSGTGFYRLGVRNQP